MTAINVSLIYAFMVLTMFTFLVTFNHKIKMPYRWYIVSLSFLWPAVLGIGIAFVVRLTIGIIKLYYTHYSKTFHQNWQNLK